MKKFVQYLCTPLLPASIGGIDLLNASNTNIMIILAFGLFEEMCITVYDIDKYSPIRIVLDNFITPFFFILFVINQVILSSKRLHDINLSGWWVMISLIPVIIRIGEQWMAQSLILIALVSFHTFMLLVPGNKQDNRFGPTPLKNTKGDYCIAVISTCMVAIFIAGISILLLYYRGNSLQ